MDEGQGTKCLLEDRQVGLPWHLTQSFHHALERPPHDPDTKHAAVRRAGASRRTNEGAVVPDAPALGGETEPRGPGDFVRLAEVRLGTTKDAGRIEQAAQQSAARARRSTKDIRARRFVHSMRLPSFCSR